MRDYITRVSQTDDDGTPTTYGAHVKESTRIEEGNGVDPSIVRWLLSIGVFLTLDDLGIALPEKEERFHWIAPERELGAGLYSLDAVRKEASLLAAKGDMSMFSAWMQAALGWPLCSDQPELYLHPDHRKVVEKLREDGRINEADAYTEAHTKIWTAAVPFIENRPESEIVRQIADTCARDWHGQADKAVVYVSGVKRPANKHLYQAMKRRGLKPFILTTPSDSEVGKWCNPADYAKCELEQRETVIADALAEKDINVLIVNPPLVATGLDLIAFNRLHFCGLPTYSVYTFEQSMCRLHRPGQQKKVTIDFWVYGADPTTTGSAHNQLQALGMAVMSDKVRASAVVSGNVGAGLAALNQTGSDIMTTLRDLLLNENVNNAPVLNAAGTISPENVTPQQRSVDARYAWIEAEIERYDDLRKQCVVAASMLPAAPLMPAPDLTLLQLSARVTSPLSEETLPLFKVEAASVMGVSEAIEEAEVAVPEVNVLALLTAEVNDIGTTADPFALTLIAPVKAAKPAVPRRRKPHLSQAPDTSPAVKPISCPTPDMLPLFMTQRVTSGLQIPLF